MIFSKSDARRVADWYTADCLRFLEDKNAKKERARYDTFGFGEWRRVKRGKRIGFDVKWVLGNDKKFVVENAPFVLLSEAVSMFADYADTFESEKDKEIVHRAIEELRELKRL